MYNAKWGIFGKWRLIFYHQSLTWTRKGAIYAPGIKALLFIFPLPKAETPFPVKSIFVEMEVYLFIYF